MIMLDKQTIETAEKLAPENIQQDVLKAINIFECGAAPLLIREALWGSVEIVHDGKIVDSDAS